MYMYVDLHIVPSERPHVCICAPPPPIILSVERVIIYMIPRIRTTSIILGFWALQKGVCSKSIYVYIWTGIPAHMYVRASKLRDVEDSAC